MPRLLVRSLSGGVWLLALSGSAALGPHAVFGHDEPAPAHAFTPAEDARVSGGVKVEYWLGTLDMGPRRAPLTLLVTLRADAEGAWSGVIDIPPQAAASGSRGVALSDLRVEPAAIAFVMPSQNGDVMVELAGAAGGERMSGRFVAAGAAMPLRMRRVDESVARDARVRRPQEEAMTGKEYSTREVRVAAPDGPRLAGLITLPKGASPEAPVPGVVLLGDLGPHDRDHGGDGMGWHRPFLVLRDRLARAGVAVLTLDDRGVGANAGDPLGEFGVTPDIAAADAAAALGELARTPGVDPRRVGVLGLGEGAVTAAMAAQLAQGEPGVVLPEWAVLLAPRGVTLQESMVSAARWRLEQEGEPASFVQARTQARERVLQAAAQEARAGEAAPEDAPIEDALRGEFEVVHAHRPGPIPAGVPDVPIREEAGRLRSPSIRARLEHDPSGAYAALGVPTLVLAGEQDGEFVSGVHTPRVVDALKRGGAAVTLRTLPGRNHLLQPCSACTLSEYAQIETTIDPDAMETILTWVLSETAGSR